tara:strand:- start:1633 stop:2850 length:1218 start_codon:yes stop_codon:yes gene_type:complete
VKVFLLQLATLICFSIAKFLLRRGIIFIAYGDAFGHQAWNTEHHARKYYSIFDRFPKIIAFQRSVNIPNKALLAHHRSHGVWVIHSSNVFSRLFYYARAKWIKRPQHETSLSKDINDLIFCHYSMDELHLDPKTEDIKVAFPLTHLEQRQATRLLISEHLEQYKYFCFHDRTDTYKNLQEKIIGSKYRNSEHYEQARNTALETIFSAAELMHKKGIQAVRLGAAPEQTVGVDFINDYSSSRSSRDDFADLALINYCKFFVGPNSGIWLFTRSFNRPICLVNVFPWPWINLPASRDRHNVIVPKKLWHTSEKRFLTIKEMTNMETRFHWKRLYDSSFFKSLSIEVVENTSEEICGAVTELNDRIDGEWNGPDYLVADFLTKDNIGHCSNAYISEFFVRENKDIFTY